MLEPLHYRPLRLSGQQCNGEDNKLQPVAAETKLRSKLCWNYYSTSADNNAGQCTALFISD